MENIHDELSDIYNAFDELDVYLYELEKSDKELYIKIEKELDIIGDGIAGITIKHCNYRNKLREERQKKEI